MGVVSFIAVYLAVYLAGYLAYCSMASGVGDDFSVFFRAGDLAGYLGVVEPQMRKALHVHFLLGTQGL